jgi:hypothetical protein
MAEKPEQSPGLTDQIEELEGLVEKESVQSRVSVVGDQVIPILDELVTPDQAGDDIEGTREIHNEDPGYTQLVEEVEEKLSHELDEVVNLLKGNLKDSILLELQGRMKKGPDNDEKE